MAAERTPAGTHTVAAAAGAAGAAARRPLPDSHTAGTPADSHPPSGSHTVAAAARSRTPGGTQAGPAGGIPGAGTPTATRTGRAAQREGIPAVRGTRRAAAAGGTAGAAGGTGSGAGIVVVVGTDLSAGALAG